MKMTGKNFSAIILSAGYSSRMGSLKPLLKFKNKTALELLVETFKKCNIEDIIVVVGYRAHDIIDNLNYLKVKWVINDNYDEGMYSSVKEGVKALDNKSDAVFIIPVDIPIIKTNTIQILQSEYLSGKSGIVYPTFNGKRGHPPLISTIYKKSILKNLLDGGLKNLLNLYNWDSKDIQVFDFGSVTDMDTPLDYEKLLDYFKLNNVPNEDECKAILNYYNVPINIIHHCRAVACEAANICNKLIQKGYINVDVNLIRAAALLHDIGRMEKNHPEVGKKILENLGYEKVGNIIAEHMDIHLEGGNEVTEKEIVYLADKLVLGDRLVPIEKRFKKSFEKYHDNYKILDKINSRLKNAEIIKNKINNIIGEN